MNSAQHIVIFAVRLYRWGISPLKTFLFGPLAQCRFTPTCSQYAQEAVQVHGVLAGGWFSLKRICRCHPWGGCGHDPVPTVASSFGRELVNRMKSAGRPRTPDASRNSMAGSHSRI